MSTVRRIITGGILCCLLGTSVGCELWPHDLQPHRLWRLNRQTAMSSDAYFSVGDPLPNSEIPTADFTPQPNGCD